MASFDNILQFLISGISTGAIYAVVGLGYMVIYNVTRVVNFAQGEFVMLGGMLTASFVVVGAPLWLAILAAALVTTAIGMIMYRLVIYPIRRAPSFALILVSFGASIVIRGVATLVWGTNPKTVPYFSGQTALNLGEVIVNPQVFWVLGGTILMAVALYVFFERTVTGKAFRACSVSPFLAGLAGIRMERLGLLAFAISACLAAIGGALISPLVYPTVGIGVYLSVKGFMAALIGGLDRIEGVILGGFLLGIVEALGAGLVSSGYKEVITMAVFLVVLSFRRQGLLGGAQAGAV